MQITRVILDHVRSFEYLELNLESGTRNKKWAVFAGDNGEGKSTVLRSIAMGLCDGTSAAGLLRELSGEFIGYGQNEAVITIELVHKGRRYTVRTTIRYPQIELVTQDVYKGGIKDIKKKNLLDSMKFPWNRLFVCGYGAGRGTEGTADYRKYKTVDSVYSLLNYDQPMQNPELAYRRLVDNARKKPRGKKAKDNAEQEVHRNVQRLLCNLLMLGKDDRIDLTSTGIEVIRAGQAAPVPLGALGDGYTATMTWVLDLISWWMLYVEPDMPELGQIRGVVLVDEIEQHLHPRMQREIVSRLKAQFPRVQVICATHSPLVLSACGEIEIHSLARGKDTVTKAHGWLAEDVYRDIMGVQTTRAKVYDEAIELYQKLHLKSLRQSLPISDKKKIKELDRKFRSLPGTDPITVLTKLGNLLEDLKGSREGGQE